MNDYELMAAFKSGNHAAIKQIFTFYHKPLCYFAQGYVKNIGEAEDIVAETFIKLIRDRNKIDTRSAMKGYLYEVAKNYCLNYLTHVKRKTASHKEIIHLAKKDENFVEAKIIKAELLKVVMEEAERLPPMMKKIFKMIFVDDLSTAEISQRLNISMDTVRVQKARALASLKTVFLKDRLLLIAFMLFVNKFPQ